MNIATWMVIYTTVIYALGVVIGRKSVKMDMVQKHDKD